MLIPLDSIAVINRQRKTMDPAAVQALAVSINANGLLHPIVVRRPFETEAAEVGEANYVLCVGGRRLAAHAILGRDSIEANLKEGLDPLTAEIVELEENLAREDISWPEEVAARERIHRLQEQLNPFQTMAQTAELAGITHTQMGRDIKLAKLVQEDPSLKNMKSKGAAFRAAEHKAHIKKRVDNVEAADLSSLRMKLRCAKGEEFIKAIPDKSIDLVFSDLPYGIDYFVNSSSGDDAKGQYNDSFAAVRPFIVAAIPEMVRVVKPTGWIVLFMCYEWHGWLQDMFKYCCKTHGVWNADKEQKCSTGLRMGNLGGCETLQPEMPPWIWTRKGSGSFGHHPDLHAANRFEMIVVVNGGSAKLLRKPVENVLDYPPVVRSERLHVMQKPFELCADIIDRCTIPGEKVLDICMGSGAHLAAAAAKGRDFLGCDINPDNVEAAIALVSQHVKK